jgi:hypothetical protein
MPKSLQPTARPGAVRHAYERSVAAMRFYPRAVSPSVAASLRCWALLVAVLGRAASLRCSFHQAVSQHVKRFVEEHSRALDVHKRFAKRRVHEPFHDMPVFIHGPTRIGGLAYLQRSVDLHTCQSPPPWGHQSPGAWGQGRTSKDREEVVPGFWCGGKLRRPLLGPTLRGGPAGADVARRTRRGRRSGVRVSDAGRVCDGWGRGLLGPEPQAEDPARRAAASAGCDTILRR